MYKIYLFEIIVHLFDSESGGGYSDAPTAVVSDAEGHSELFPLSSSVMQADYGSG